MLSVIVHIDRTVPLNIGQRCHAGPGLTMIAGKINAQNLRILLAQLPNRTAGIHVHGAVIDQNQLVVMLGMF